MNRQFFLLSFILFFGISCSQNKNLPSDAPPPVLEIVKNSQQNLFEMDDLDTRSLSQAIQASFRYFNRLPEDTVFLYGEEEYTVEEVKQSMLLFLGIWENREQDSNWGKKINQFFHLYKSPGSEKDGSVLYTGYYEPVLQASQQKTDTFQYPAYGVPEDLKVLDLGAFRSKLENHTIVYRMEDGEILPYHTREEIMSQKVLEEKAEPLVWFKNPLDLFFLQIQGSGIVELENGEQIRLGYAGANGRQYFSIGRLLIQENKIPREEVSMQSIRAYLEANPQELERVIYSNQSYTFFQIRTTSEGPFGSINVPLTPNRSIATDYRLFPKGGLAFIETEIIQCTADGNCPKSKKIRRFVVNQDTGGAIRGFERADIFMGRGDVARETAGRQNSQGKLWFLVAKKEYLSDLSNQYSLVQ